MITGVTSTGFKYEINKKRLENYEVIEALSELQDNPFSLPKVINLILGEAVQDLKNHCRDENGIVSSIRMNDEITEIFQTNPLKK